MGTLIATCRSHLDAQHATLAGGPDADRDERGHGHDPAALAHLVIERIKEEARIAGLTERARTEGVDLGIEPGTDAADLAP